MKRNETKKDKNETYYRKGEKDKVKKTDYMGKNRNKKIFISR